MQPINISFIFQSAEAFQDKVFDQIQFLKTFASQRWYVYPKHWQNKSIRLHKKPRP